MHISVFFDFDVFCHRHTTLIAPSSSRGFNYEFQLGVAFCLANKRFSVLSIFDRVSLFPYIFEPILSVFFEISTAISILFMRGAEIILKNNFQSSLCPVLLNIIFRTQVEIRHHFCLSYAKQAAECLLVLFIRLFQFE